MSGNPGVWEESCGREATVGSLKSATVGSLRSATVESVKGTTVKTLQSVTAATALRILKSAPTIEETWVTAQLNITNPFNKKCRSEEEEDW